ncbi:FAD-binding protein [Desulfobacula sp.]|uniref:FAD-binding protein n=1 Tax=Desulfobacula sp. TaxID=2593537 RepID=UPI002609E74E|nr:FAD-binding protein [Desulfobacula sp.]
MNKKSKIWEMIKSDILIIGGGFGGLWAAVRAAECGASVTLVDKSFAGKSGHSYFAGGAMVVLLPEDDPDKALMDIVLGNEWLVDQDMALSVLQGSFQRLKDLESFGIPFRKQKGRYQWTKARGTQYLKNLWPEHATAADEVTLLRKIALSRDVRIVDHVYVYDLITSMDGSIAGAVGIGSKTAKNVLLKADSVVVATNSGGFRGHHLACELQGTGPFMAYDAGARIKNPEFHYINIRPAKHEIEGSGIMPAIGVRWKNGLDEPFMEKYDPELKDRATVMKIVVSATKEAMKGNGPITMDVESMTEEQRERFRILQVSHGWMPILFEKCRREEGYDPLENNIEWQPAYESNKLGIWADIDCKTHVKGLYAAGMARTLGVNPFTGWSIAACTWSGYTAGENAALNREAAGNRWLDQTSLAAKQTLFFAPLNNKNGSDPDNVVYELQKILFPADVLILMSENGLQNALKKVVDLRDEKMANLSACDTRTLIKAKETQTMVCAAEMTLKAAIMRKETRPNIFYRKDMEHADNKNWLKWIQVTKGNQGEMKFATQDIPFDQYRFKPNF